MTKTVIEISHSTLKKAESAADIRGITLSQLVSGLIEESVVLPCHKQNEKPWMVGFGDLADLAEENHRILELIEEEFGVVDENDCQ
ncbi:MAG: hypothetical protein OXI60_05745 [Acidiferrobacterales bacterium]|nr:hypothetical protein [Acidiferrobacterales bacterium]